MRSRSLALVFSGAIALLGSVARGQSPTSSDAVFATVPAGDWASATFAGGCFWCMEPPFDKIEGVAHTIAGYMGGTPRNPTYQQVSSGRTGHAEVVLVLYDPAKVTYEQLLAVYWSNIDPLNPNGQFCDIGPQYRSEIFYHTDEQRSLAQASKDALAGSGRFTTPIATSITAAGAFWPAEEYHQDYYLKNPIRYTFYSTTCGRARRLDEVWGRR